MIWFNEHYRREAPDGLVPEDHSPVEFNLCDFDSGTVLDVLERLDQVGITGSLRDDIASAVSVRSLNADADPVIDDQLYLRQLSFLASRCPPISQDQIARLAGKLAQTFKDGFEEARRSGIDNGDLIRSSIAFDALLSIVGSWGHRSVIEPLIGICPYVEAPCHISVLQYAPRLSCRIVYDSNNGTGINVRDDGTSIFTYKLRIMSDGARSLPSFDFNEVPQDSLCAVRQSIKTGMDNNRALLICFACHLAQCSEALNARGNLLKFDPSDSFDPDVRRSIAGEVSGCYDLLTACVNALGLESLPSIAEALRRRYRKA